MLHVDSKFLSQWSDHLNAMLDSGTMILLITALTSGICVLCMYSVYGNVIRHETTLHDLRNRVELLQNQQTLRIAELKGEIAPDDVEMIPDAIELPADAPNTTDDVAGVIPEDQAKPVSSSTNAA